MNIHKKTSKNGQNTNNITVKLNLTTALISHSVSDLAQVWSSMKSEFDRSPPVTDTFGWILTLNH